MLTAQLLVNINCTQKILEVSNEGYCHSWFSCQQNTIGSGVNNLYVIIEKVLLVGHGLYSIKVKINIIL